jgi:hypothetical protein
MAINRKTYQYYKTAPRLFDDTSSQRLADWYLKHGQRLEQKQQRRNDRQNGVQAVNDLTVTNSLEQFWSDAEKD